MLKIKNRSTGNKRIRLTALDSAMSNIDNSVGAIAKVGREVLLCLGPATADTIPDMASYLLAPWGMPEYVLPMPELDYFWDSTAGPGGNGDTRDSNYDTLWNQQHAVENNVVWVVEVDGVKIGETYNLITEEDLPWVQISDLLATHEGLRVIYLDYTEEWPEGEGLRYWTVPNYSGEWLENLLKAAHDLDLTQGRDTLAYKGKPIKHYFGEMFINQGVRPHTLKLTPNKPVSVLEAEWDFFWRVNYGDPSLSAAAVFPLPALQERLQSDGPWTVDPVTGAVEITLQPITTVTLTPDRDDVNLASINTSADGPHNVTYELDVDGAKTTFSSTTATEIGDGDYEWKGVVWDGQYETFDVKEFNGVKFLILTQMSGDTTYHTILHAIGIDGLPHVIGAKVLSTEISEYRRDSIHHYANLNPWRGVGETTDEPDPVSYSNVTIRPPKKIYPITWTLHPGYFGENAMLEAVFQTLDGMNREIYWSYIYVDGAVYFPELESRKLTSEEILAAGPNANKYAYQFQVPADFTGGMFFCGEADTPAIHQSVVL